MWAGGGWKEAGVGIAGNPRSSRGLGGERGSVHLILPARRGARGIHSPRSAAPPLPAAAHPCPAPGPESHELWPPPGPWHIPGDGIESAGVTDP